MYVESDVNQFYVHSESQCYWDLGMCNYQVIYFEHLCLFAIISSIPICR